MTDNHLLLSIIIPVYNREHTIKRAIESVLNQSYTHLELLIIDDGSVDNTATVVEEFQKIDDRIIYYRQENKGVSSARNTGISLSKGDYIAFLDSDDEMFECNFSKRLQFMNLNNIDLSISKSENQIINLDFTHKVRKNIFINYLLTGGHFHVMALLINQRLLANKGVKFHENLFIGEDKLFIIQCMIHANCIDFENFISGRIHCDTNNSITANYKTLTSKRNYLISRVLISCELFKNKYFTLFALSLKNIVRALKGYLFHFVINWRKTYLCQIFLFKKKL